MDSNMANNVNNPEMNGNMEDNLEQPIPDVSFEGIKLSVESNNLLDDNSLEAAKQRGGTNANANNPEQPHTPQSPENVPSGFYFASQAGRLEAAAAACESLTSVEEDGNLLGVWLLTEVDHWDNEKERVALVSENTLLLVKFDFITNRIKNYRRVLFGQLSCIQRGAFTYPEKTLAQARPGEGIRIFWNGSRQLSVFEKWNPFSETVPYTTLTSHPLQNEDTRQPQSYQIGPFFQTLQQAVMSSRAQHHPNLPPVSLTETPIALEIYVGLSSMVYNQSKLGFFRERGGVSF